MNNQNTVLRVGISGAVINIAGIFLSGPVSMLLVSLTHPNPAWQTPKLWAENFHPVQTMPFFGGFLLLVGYMLMIAAAHRLAEEKDKIYTQVALIFTAAFATLIFFNYINQTTFLPALAKNYRPEYDFLISTFSFSNPRSLCWAIEMWGYALLGLATCFAAPVFRQSTTEKTTAFLMLANGVISILGGFITSANLDWVFTQAGMINYVLWNVLVLFLAIFFLLSLRQRMANLLQPAEKLSTDSDAHPIITIY
jgi:hypothetical protein